MAKGAKAAAPKVDWDGKKKVSLALQGGGAHGAFTWGVLDHLLEQTAVDIGWVSATSAGAVNAVAMASGLAEGGPKAAQAKLRAVWASIYESRVPDLIRLNPLFASWSASPAAANMAKLMSPYDFNPMGLDPLRKLLNDHIDFAQLRAASPIELMIAATDVSTGQARYFTRDEMTVEAVLASACLPVLHHAVEIDGRAYWDGGYSANPGIVRLALDSPVGDTLIVMLNATTRQGVPKTAEEIASETGRLTFNAPLIRDVEIIAAVREAEGGFLARSTRRASRLSPLASHRFHLVEAGRHTSSLPAGSKMKPDWGLFTYLHGAGRTECYKWLDGALPSIGRRSTVDLKARFLAPLPSYKLPVLAPRAPETAPRLEAPPANDGAASQSEPSPIAEKRAGRSLR